MSSNLFIPKKLKVGFQKRNDTYQGKLAYIIYYDERGKLRKETSFKGWIQEELGTIEIDNVPFNGFVLNKSITRFPWDSFGNVTTKIRIFDTRGMEFEITSDNLLGILTCTDCIKRDLQGEFVYAWIGKELVLLPCSSEEYKSAVNFTNIRLKSLSTKELKAGQTYITRQAEPVLYLGRLSTSFPTGKPENFGYAIKKTHVFAKKAEGATTTFDLRNLVKKDSCSGYISDKYGADTAHPDFADLYMGYHADRIRHEAIKQIHLAPIVADEIRQRLKDGLLTYVVPKSQPNLMYQICQATPYHFPDRFDNTDLFWFREPSELDIEARKATNLVKKSMYTGFYYTRTETAFDLIIKRCYAALHPTRTPPYLQDGSYRTNLQHLCKALTMPTTADFLSHLVDRLYKYPQSRTFYNYHVLYGNVPELCELCLIVNLEFESGLIQPLGRIAYYDERECQ